MKLSTILKGASQTRQAFASCCLIFLSGVACSAVAEVDLSLPAGAFAEENGQVALPAGSASSLWLDFYSGASVDRDTTARLRAVLSEHGFSFAPQEADAKASVTVTGFVRLYNDARSYDTGRVYFGELLEPNGGAGGIASRTATSTRGRDALDSDAGVAMQATRALNAGGAGHAVAGGIGIAILVDRLADATGLRAALDRGFRKAVGAKGNRPLFCGSDCKRTTHEVVLMLTVWEGKQSNTYTLTLKQVAPEIDESLISPLAEYGLAQVLDKLTRAAKS